MVKFDEFYLRADDISSVETCDTGDKRYPNGLRVIMTDGRRYGVNYINEGVRDKEKKLLISEINREMGSSETQEMLRDIQYAIRVLNTAISCIDKRQSRIQRILKKILKNSDLED